MPLLGLTKITNGLSKTWSGYLRDWDRSLRSGNYPETTRYNYLLAATQLAGYLGECSPDPDADAAAEDPAEVTKAHIEAFQSWMIQTRSASTALNKHKGLQQFFKWLMVEEEEIDRSPMERVKQPKMPTTLIPVIRDDDTKKVIGTCRGKIFIQLRDEAIIRPYYNTGARLSEVGNPLAAVRVVQGAGSNFSSAAWLLGNRSRTRRCWVVIRVAVASGIGCRRLGRLSLWLS